MDGNTNKYISWTSGLLITGMIITAGILLFNKSTPVLNAANDQSATQAQMAIANKYVAFDNQLVSGSQVLTAYRQFQNEDIFYIYVQTNINHTVQNFGMTPSGMNTNGPNFNFTTGQFTSGTMNCSTTQVQVTDITNPNYIPPQARFRSTLLLDENKLVTGIYFKMQ